ncbi:hypothetical protein MTR_6g072090 [Medicago truncatula]|uniref:Reverse transcriptase zinc-binding domain-containing protein n=1 Tax=Medicago truncatula TaxID=3880 RepID=G7KHW8_MEDTR|nr:hypothetical protein MTR_6g072090 [Medicago truncatula]
MEIRNLLTNVTLQDTELDVWLWRPNIDDGYTVRGCGQNETIDHLIIRCPIFGDLWQQIKTWIGVFSVDPHQVLDHYYQFVYSSGGYAPRMYFLHLICLCGIWVL